MGARFSRFAWGFMDIHSWLAFVVASLALLIIPGPTILLVISYALSRGPRVALATVAGVTLGDIIAMTASLAGLGALVLTSAVLFTALKWAGAAYLVFLGINMLRHADKAALGEVAEVAGETRRVFWNACTVTALNPKSITFFIAFVPQFLDPTRALLPQFVVMEVTFVSLASAVVLAYALLAGRLRGRIARPSTLSWLHRGGGVALIGLGTATALAKRA